MPRLRIDVFIPESHVMPLREALNALGVLTIGQYDNCAAVYPVRGFFRPLAGAKPYSGQGGEVNEVEECVFTFRCDADRIAEVVRVIRSIHPYETPVFDIMGLWEPE